MRTTLLLFFCSYTCLFFPKAIVAQDSLLNIVIVAGQSNAMNWHADAQQIDSTSSNQSIPFYYHSGLPPDRGFDVPFNATSDSNWVNLSYQSQQPFIKFFPNFFGPEITLANELSKPIPNLAVFKSAYGGSNLALDWQKGSTSGNQLYDTMLGQFKHATALLDSSNVQYKVVGLFWMQGESDAANQTYANNYESNLKNLIQNIRADVGKPSLSVVLGRIGAQLPSPYDFKETVRTAQLKVAEDDALVSWVSIDDQPLDTDDIHLLADGVKVLGERMANAWLNLSPTNIENPENEIPSEISLSQNYPNPFNPTTTIRFGISETSNVRLDVFNILGQRVATLVNEPKTAGWHSIPFDASALPTGIYMYQITTNSSRQVKKMTLIK
jgi:hypothetical protein